MGSVCCCFTVPDVEDHPRPASNGQNHPASNGQHRNFCRCFSCSFQNFINKCGTIFGQAQETSETSANQGLSSSTAVVPIDSSCNIIRSRNRGLPNISTTRQPQMQQQDFAFRRHDKGTSHSRVEPEPDINAADVEITQKLLRLDKLLRSAREGGSKECRPESPKKVTGVQYDFPSSEDEDECPTCLEEYTPENPKITTKCSHHYHLGCIYEWQERSDKCPFCGKLLEFDETN